MPPEKKNSPSFREGVRGRAYFGKATGGVPRAFPYLVRSAWASASMSMMAMDCGHLG